MAEKGKQSIAYRQGAPQVGTVTARHGQTRSCGTYVLHDTTHGKLCDHRKLC